MKDLAGKTAVVTGGGSGIGKGIVLALMEAGMNVVVADIELENAQAVAAQAETTRAIAVRTDVTDYASVSALADRAFAEFGAVHLVCNNAGVLLMGPMLSQTPRDWEWIFAVNVFGVVNGIYAFVPRLLAQGGEAHVVNTISTAAFETGANLAAYTASKHAASIATEALRAELDGTPVKVSGFYPGGVATNIATAQRNRQDRFGPPAAPSTARPRLAGIANMAARAAQVLDPVAVGRLVRQGILDDAPWIFSHPDWVTSDRWDEIAAAASAARKRGNSG